MTRRPGANRVHLPGLKSESHRAWSTRTFPSSTSPDSALPPRYGHRKEVNYHHAGRGHGPVLGSAGSFPLPTPLPISNASKTVERASRLRLACLLSLTWFTLHTFADSTSPASRTTFDRASDLSLRGDGSHLLTSRPLFLPAHPIEPAKTPHRVSKRE